MVGHVVADAGTAAMAAMSTATGSSTSTVVAAAAGAAMAMVVTPSLAETAWREIAGGSRVGKGRPSMALSVTTKTANTLAILRGGGLRASSTIASKVKNAKDSKGDNSLATRGKSVAFMALAMACHYLGTWIVGADTRFFFNCLFSLVFHWIGAFLNTCFVHI